MGIASWAPLIKMTIVKLISFGDLNLKKTKNKNKNKKQKTKNKTKTKKQKKTCSIRVSSTFLHSKTLCHKK